MHKYRRVQIALHFNEWCKSHCVSIVSHRCESRSAIYYGHNLDFGSPLRIHNDLNQRSHVASPIVCHIFLETVGHHMITFG